MSKSEGSILPNELVRADRGLQYWEGREANLTSMLGGINLIRGLDIDKLDLQSSRAFLARRFIGTKKEKGRRIVASALEGGAGVGRVTRGVLLNVAEQVDVIEPVTKFTAALQGEPGVRNIFNVGLEEWQPIQGVQYDLIWTQWCVGHLTDEQLVRYLERCKTALKDGGEIVIKENITRGEYDLFDETDSSVTRAHCKFESLFKQAGLRVVWTMGQLGIPEKFAKQLLPTRHYALKPAVPKA